MTTSFCTSVDGTRIAYDISGSGPALLLLHGAGKTRTDWHKAGYVERLKDKFTVISIDLRGCGESDTRLDPADYGIEKLCEDVVAVADACDAQRFAVWGYSLGGNIARYLGASSARVTAIAMIGVPFGPAVSQEFGQFIDDFVKKWQPVIKAAKEGQLPASKVKRQIPTLAACFQAMRSWPQVEATEVGCPVLLLCGTRNKSTWEWLSAHRDALDAAGVQVEEIAGLTHNQEFSKIEQVFPQVSSFLISKGIT